MEQFPERKEQLEVLWTVTSDGRSVAELEASLRAKGRKLTSWAEDVMSKPEFGVPTTGQEYHFVVIRGDELTDAERTTENVYAEAARRGLILPSAEAGALLRERYTQAELGFSRVAVMHEPIKSYYRYPHVLYLFEDSAGQWLHAWRTSPAFKRQWPPETVFAFLAPNE
jgi:hypothetical protein